MADEVNIDKAVFAERLGKIVNTWKAQDDANDAVQTLRVVDSMLILLGTQSEEVAYQKTASLHIWLLGYEFPSTMMLITREGITFVSSANKAKYLESLDGAAGLKVQVLKRSKDDAQNKKAWQDIIAKMSSAGKKVGVFAKDAAQGKVADEWKAVYNDVKGKEGFEETDVGPAMGYIWGPKDEAEVGYMRMAAKMTSRVMSTKFVDEISDILDGGKKVTHEKLAGRLEEVLDDDKFWKKAKGLADADMALADWSYTPIIQSGGDYDLRPSALSNTKRIEAAENGGVIIASMGMKYRSYNANIGRTWLVDPHKNQQKAFTFLWELQGEIVEKHLRPGKTGKDVYQAAREYISSRKPELLDHFTKNAGFAIGLEFRDSAYLLANKCNMPLQDNMTVSLSLGFTGLDDPNHKNETYSLLLIDTVKISSDGPAQFLTERVKQASEQFFYQDKDDEEVEPVERSLKKQNVTAGGKVLRNKSNNQMDVSVANRIRNHQQELAATKQEEGLRKYADDEGEGGHDKGKTFKKFESYKRAELIPTKAQDLKVMVDIRNSTLILPIYGFAVPFHINTLKNVSKNEEGEFTYLRFNFISPGQIAGRKDDTPFEDPDATFVRSMTFRSADTYHFAELFKDITELKKQAAKREAEKKELSDVVEQDKLIVSKGRPQMLREVFPRPALEGKRVPGDLEIHQNGLRFTSPLKDQKIDVLFNNVKHMFFQPCDKELIVILHFHLKAPIIIGKKKTRDIQFYREASDVQFDETGNRKRKYRAGDEDELELEQEERRRRAQLNKEFKRFAEAIAEAADDLTVDTPYRELGFDGVPFRTNVWLAPTSDCLVHLTDSPFTVVTLAEVEIAHLERVQYGLKNFDLVFVFKDFSKPPLHINSIPTQALDNVKEWLDSVDILVSEGPVNLQWNQILRTIQDDPYDFFVNGGWSFLRSSDEDGGSSDEESEEGSAYEESDAFEAESSESDDDADSGSDFDEDESGSDASGSDAGVDSDESEGMDWDEMEKKAARADQKKGNYDSDDGGATSKGKKKRR